MLVDLTSVVHEPASIMARLERLSSYSATVSTLSYAHRIKGRELVDLWLAQHPKPEKGVKEWEMARDSHTSDERYVGEYLEKISDDLSRKISVSQTLLNFCREELRAS